jgi:hypothetical protein
MYAKQAFLHTSPAKTGEMYAKTALFAYKSCEPDGITEEVCIPDAGLFRIAELIQPMNPTFLRLNVKIRLFVGLCVLLRAM